MSEVYDYIIIGGGSAGCVVAAELARRTDGTILMLERGPAAEAHPATLRADGYKETFVNDAVFLERFTEPQQHAAAQRIFAGTGGVLGGSGSVNGMVYTRGAREDFDAWPEGWRWDEVVEDFEAIEATLKPQRRAPTAWTEACISAAEACGFRRKEDLNDGELGGVIGYEWMNYTGDTRRSSYVAFLAEPGLPASLTVVCEAACHRVVFDDARRAVAVEYAAHGQLRRAEARREIILAAGALETPKLMMLSGVGPSQALRFMDIPVVHASEAVGCGLHDHPNVPVFFRARKQVDCHYPQLYSFDRTLEAADLPPGQSDTCYVFWPAPSAMKEATQRILPGMVLPPGLYDTWAKGAVRGAVGAAFDRRLVQRFVERLYAIVVILGKPRSRGRLRLRSTDPLDPPRVDPAYLEHPDDMRTLVEGVKRARRIARSSGLAEWGSLPLMPGPLVRSDAQIARWVAKNVITTYHFAGTCAMGTSDDHVVDPRLRVRGVTGLRVADASAIPVTPVSALNAPSMLVGYRAARYIAEDAS